MNRPGELNQREVAEALGVSRVLVQKIEERAFEKIRKILEERKINKQDLLND